MRPWSELDDDSQAEDVAIVEALPAVLAVGGLQIVRRADLAGSGSGAGAPGR